jgi:hypothetical protein
MEKNTNTNSIISLALNGGKVDIVVLPKNT